MGSSIKTAAAVIACRACRSMLRAMHRGGTTTPGKLAMAVDSGILEKVSAGMEVILVTGTNGKTTTCRMIEHALTSSGRDALTNSSGANLLPGVVAEFVAGAGISGRPKKRFAVIECDEGALKQIVPLVHPKVIVVTNLFRDQLDRYGDITGTLGEIRTAAEKDGSAVLCLNADCSLTSSLAEGLPNPVIYYGIDCPAGGEEDADVSDARYCPKCGAAYTYSYHTYAHLGGFSCPSCGYSRKDTDVGVTSLISSDMRGSRFEMHIKEGGSDTVTEVSCALPAIYNIYNAAACVAAFVSAGYHAEDAVRSLASVTSSFGRMETFDLDGVPVQMILIKNPAGCGQAVSYISGTDGERSVAVSINDRTGDGHDISWIWDADLDRICTDPRVKEIFVSGDRAEEVRLRLKYGGADVSKIVLVKSDAGLIDRMRKSSVPVFMLPNYTSMLSLRVALGEVTGKGDYWNV